MATIKKRSNKRFTAEVRINGHYQSKTFDNKVQALAWTSYVSVKVRFGSEYEAFYSWVRWYHK